MSGSLRIEGTVTHAHPECGNGVTWSLELRRGTSGQRLAGGISQGGKGVAVGPVEKVAVQPGDLVSLLIGPRDGDHSCDLTDLELKLTSSGATPREWSLTGAKSDNILAGNPHADKAGNEGVWHFYSEPVSGASDGSIIPAGLLPALAGDRGPAEKQQLAVAVQTLLDLPRHRPPTAPMLRCTANYVAGRPSTGGHNHEFAAIGRRRIVSLGIGRAAQFGKRPDGTAIDPASLCVQAPSVIEVRLPADLVAGSELMTTGMLDNTAGAEGSVQLQVVTTKPGPLSRLRPSGTTIGTANGTWSSNNQTVSYATPIVVTDGSAAPGGSKPRSTSFADVSSRVVLHENRAGRRGRSRSRSIYREDDALRRLMLDDAQTGAARSAVDRAALSSARTR